MADALLLIDVLSDFSHGDEPRLPSAGTQRVRSGGPPSSAHLA
jgi:hypothetical protein